MPYRNTTRTVLIIELLGFITVIVFIWLDEVLNLPHYLFGFQKTPINLAECIVETGVIIFLGLIVAGVTVHFVKRLHTLNDEKDKFFSIISHDLRNAFATILGNSELMLKGVIDASGEETKRLVQRTYASVKKIYTLLENLLHWAQLQMGRAEFYPEKIELKGSIDSVIELVSEKASMKSISLRNLITKGLYVYADVSMVNSVIQNILINAIKFTDRGGRVTITADSADKEVKISVSDSGVGMDKQTLKKIFRIDSCYSGTGTSGEKGTGLGLILCKELVEKNGGRISVKSEQRKGSVFSFSLPKSRD